VKLLPDVVSAGEKAGTLAYQWHGISKGVPVTAAMGDLQCYILSKVQDDYSAGEPQD
jgi:sugar (pentulose or hexulose) kinase